MSAGRYSDHYFEHVRTCWEKLPNIKPDEAVIPAEILKSWHRCVNRGLDPRQAGAAVEALRTQQAQTVPPEGHIATFGRYGMLRLINNKVPITLYVFELTDSKRAELPVAEERIGTNAVDLACRLKRDVFISGPEHYTQVFHHRYTYAAPILDVHQQICGVCCVSSDNIKTTREMSHLVQILTSLGNAIYWIERGERAQESAVTVLLNQLPFGAVCIDAKNVIKYFNWRAVEIFNQGNYSKDEANFVRPMIQICRTLHSGQQNVRAGYGSHKREICVTALPLSDSGYEKIYLLEPTSTAKMTDNQQAKYTFDDIETTDPHTIQAKKMAATVAIHNVPVMLVGESGVGKEMFAQSIHNASSRKNGPFIALNASAIAPNLVESALFGYEKGAFTGASKEGKIGYFEAASGGTLFLDELDSIPPDVQTKLLRAISSRSIRRVGGTEDIPVDVRLISAGRIDVLRPGPEPLAFREDLYYRLSPVKIYIPNLASRRGDLPLLTRLFLEREAKRLNIPCPEPTEAFMACLQRYSWPGNVRELINTLRHTLVFLEPNQSTLESDMLPEYLLQDMQDQPSCPENTDLENESMFKLAGIVAVCKGIASGIYNVESIGQQLGLSTSTVYNYIARGKAYGLL